MFGKHVCLSFFHFSPLFFRSFFLNIYPPSAPLHSYTNLSVEHVSSHFIFLELSLLTQSHSFIRHSLKQPKYVPRPIHSTPVPIYLSFTLFLISIHQEDVSAARRGARILTGADPLGNATD
jgi:hypothetical protein